MKNNRGKIDMTQLFNHTHNNNHSLPVLLVVALIAGGLLAIVAMLFVADYINNLDNFVR